MCSPARVVSPACGLQLSVMESLSAPRLVQMRIFVPPFAPHTVVSPVDGTVSSLGVVPGRRLPAFLTVASRVNRRLVVTIESVGGRFTVALIAGLTTGVLKASVERGQRVLRGQPLGKMVYGSCVEFTGPFTPSVGVGRTRFLRRGTAIGWTR